MRRMQEIDFDSLAAQDLDTREGSLGGITRRRFLEYCAGVAATMGLSSAIGVRIAEAATAKQRPPVIWLHGQECTGCTESLLRAEHPTLESLILDQISLDYHETLCVGAGRQAEAHKHAMMEEHFGKYVLVTEGSAPLKDGGIFCMVGGRRGGCSRGWWGCRGRSCARSWRSSGRGRCWRACPIHTGSRRWGVCSGSTGTARG